MVSRADVGDRLLVPFVGGPVDGQMLPVPEELPKDVKIEFRLKTGYRMYGIEVLYCLRSREDPVYEVDPSTLRTGYS